MSQQLSHYDLSMDLLLRRLEADGVDRAVIERFIIQALHRQALHRQVMRDGSVSSRES